MAKTTGVRQRCTPECTGRCRTHRWEFHVELPAGPDGRRRQVGQGGYRTMTEASEARAEVLAQHRAGSLPDNARRKVTTAEYLEEWFESKVSAGTLRPSTQRCYRQHLDDYLVPHLGQVRLADLRPEHIDRMYRAIRSDPERAPLTDADRAGGVTRSKRPLSPASEQRLLATLRSALRRAKRRREITTDPTDGVELARADRRNVKPWSMEQFDTFAEFLGGLEDHTTGARLLPLVLVVTRTGLRLGEVCGLRWEDVDLEAQRIVVHQQAQQITREIVYVRPKTQAGEDRRVPLVPEAVAALRAWKVRQSTERLQWGAAWEPSGLVFTRPGGSGLIPASVSKTFVHLSASAGLPACRFHDLRHLAATYMLAQGVPLVLVSRVLGHSSPTITGSLYNHTVADDAAVFMERAYDRPPRLRAVP